AGGGGAGEDVHAVADELLGGGHGLVRVAAVVLVHDVDGDAVDLVRAVGGVVQTRLEAFQVLLAVAGERARLAGDHADRHLRGPGRCGVPAGLRRRRARRQNEGGRGDHGSHEQLLRNAHVRAFHLRRTVGCINLKSDSGLAKSRKADAARQVAGAVRAFGGTALGAHHYANVGHVYPVPSDSAWTARIGRRCDTYDVAPFTLQEIIWRAQNLVRARTCE